MRIIKTQKQLKQIFTKALKIGVGSGSAIMLAHFLGLKYESVAGTITLLTILTTKWETIKLSVYRILTFAFTVLISWLIFNHIGSGWIEYGLFLFIMVFFCEFFGLGATISVNAVIGAHFFTEENYSIEFIINELCLLLIGIFIAIILSLINNNKGTKKEVLRHMQYVEDGMCNILCNIALYLRNEPLDHSVWADVNILEDKIKGFIQEAYDYNNNSFSKHPEYYIEYFEMRLLQIDVIHSLHYEMRKMSYMPTQAEIIANFTDFVVESLGKMNALDIQLDRLHEIIEQLKAEQLPISREEFECRAILYHVLMDIEDFLLIKKRFVDSLAENHLNETFIK